MPESSTTARDRPQRRLMRPPAPIAVTFAAIHQATVLIKDPSTPAGVRAGAIRVLESHDPSNPLLENRS